MNTELKPYPVRRDPGVPWLGAVPQHWAIERGKRLFRKMDRPIRNADEVVTCFRDGVVTLRKNRRVRGFTESLKEIGYQGIRRGDLVIHGMDAFAGAIGVADADGKGTPVYSVCEPWPTANARYYAYLLREMARCQWIQALAKGIRERSTDFRYEGFGSQPVPLPPLHEQAAIVRFLDHADRRIRHYIRAKQKLIALLEEQKQAIIHQAVTGQIDVRTGRPYPAYKPSGVEWLGDVPEYWEVAQLRRIAVDWCDGPFGSGLKSSHYTENGIRVVRLQNIGHGEFRDSDAAFISPQHYSSLGDHSVVPGDILVAGLGDENHPAGRACVAPKGIVPAMVKADCFRFRSNNRRVDPQFVALQLTATAVIASAVLSTGATRLRTNLQSTSARSIAIPTIPEQCMVVEYVALATADIRTAQAAAAEEIVFLREYRTRLIADVVTGKLDVREAAAGLPEVDLLPAEDGLIDEADHDTGSERTRWRHGEAEGRAVADIPVAERRGREQRVG